MDLITMNENLKDKAAGDDDDDDKETTSEPSDPAEIINNLRKQLKLTQIANEQLQARVDTTQINEKVNELSNQLEKRNQHVETLQQEVEELKAQLSELKAQPQPQPQPQIEDTASQSEEVDEQAAEPPTMAGLQEQLESSQKDVLVERQLVRYLRSCLLESESEKMKLENAVEEAGHAKADYESQIAFLNSKIDAYIHQTNQLIMQAK